MAEEEAAGQVCREKKVMVAIDESEYSHYALMWVLDNLKESITNSPLLIFAALPQPNNNYTFAAPLGAARLFTVSASTPDLANSIQEQQKRVTLGILEKAKSICASRGVNAEAITEVGDAKQAICSAVQKFNINLLVIGNHGMGALKRAFIGSVSNYCVQHAKCAVLVVKKPECK